MSAALVASAGASLFDFIQGLSSSGSTAAAGGASGAATTASTAAAAPTTTKHHKHGGGGFEKLANAVTSVLQSVTANGSTDINKTITDALTKIFKNASLSPTGEVDPTDTGTQSTSSTDSAAGTAGTGGLPDAFVQTLKAFGVTPQQFQADLASALKAAQSSGTFDPSTAFKSFPSGSVVDAIG